MQARSAFQFFSQLQELGVSLHAEGDRLACSAPKGVLTSEIREALDHWKPELLTLLREAAAPVSLAETGAPQKRIVPAGRESPPPLSAAQERFYFLHRLWPDSPTHNITAFWRIDGDLSLELFRASLRVVVQRHEILRTSFQEPGGRPVQIVGDLADLPIEAEDLSGLSEQDRENEIQLAVNRQARTLFDLSAPPPYSALRSCVYRHNKAS